MTKTILLLSLLEPFLCLVLLFILIRGKQARRFPVFTALVSVKAISAIGLALIYEGSLHQTSKIVR
jgi:hypothetical protein